MVIAPFNLSELNRSPYVTATEVKGSAISASLDFGSLVPSGGSEGNDRALDELIVSASIKADNYVFGPLGTMGASVNIEPGEFRPDPVGTFRIVPYYKPILELRSFSCGAIGTALMPITLTPQNVGLYRNYFTVRSGFGTAGITIGSLSQVLGGQFGPDQLLAVEYTYVNGFANTFLTADADAGAMSISVTSSIGLYPNMPLPIWDAPNNETIQIASNYDGVSLTVPLALGLIYDHSAGTNVSQIPKTVKDAVIHFVCASVKERGSGALVISEIGFGSVSSGGGGGSRNEDDEATAYDLLDDFKSAGGQR